MRGYEQYSVDRMVRIAIAALGVIVGVVCAIVGTAAHLSSIWLIIYHMVWLVPTVVFGLLHFKHRVKRKKNKISYK